MYDELLVVYNDVSLWLDSDYVVDIVVFDLSKAFDVVSHTVLIDKLRLFGMGGSLLGWVSDSFFFIGWTMRMVVSGI